MGAAYFLRPSHLATWPETLPQNRLDPGPLPRSHCNKRRSNLPKCERLAQWEPSQLCEPVLSSFTYFMGKFKKRQDLKMANENRAVAMKKVWTDRKEWARAPTCCGCGERLEISKNPAKQRLFHRGCDAKLKSMFRAVLRGELKREELPASARANLARIGFIQASPEFKRAFANPSQRQLRVQAKVTTEEPAE